MCFGRLAERTGEFVPWKAAYEGTSKVHRTMELKYEFILEQQQQKRKSMQFSFLIIHIFHELF